MKKLTLFLLTAVLGAAFTLSATPPDRNWFTDFGKAQAEAREKNLPMFLLFTGSDVWYARDGKPGNHGTSVNLCYMDGAIRSVPFGYLRPHSKYDWPCLHTRNW